MTAENTSIKKLIPSIYQKQWLDSVIWGMILGMRMADERITIERAALQIQHHFQLTEDQLAMGTIKTCYHRMNAEYKAHLKDHKTSPFTSK